jgi:Domain of unknown function DUF488
MRECTKEPRIAVIALRTVGHFALPADAFVSLLDRADVACVVDVRSFPGSRHNRQFGYDEMERWSPEPDSDQEVSEEPSVPLPGRPETRTDSRRHA